MNIVFFLDFDNTLLDNDRLKQDLEDRINVLLGPDRARKFWQLYEEVRQEKEYVDFPRTISQMGSESRDLDLVPRLNDAIYSVSFKEYLYPNAVDTIEYLKTMGTVGILSDGDAVFQPYKIDKSGIRAAVDNNVLIYVHKEDNLDDVFARYPADHYVMVDDKPRIVSALEEQCPGSFTTVLVLQGKYARQEGFEPSPDYVISAISDLRDLSRTQFLQPGEQRTSTSR